MFPLISLQIAALQIRGVSLGCWCRAFELDNLSLRRRRCGSTRSRACYSIRGFSSVLLPHLSQALGELKSLLVGCGETAPSTIRLPRKQSVIHTHRFSTEFWLTREERGDRLMSVNGELNGEVNWELNGELKTNATSIGSLQQTASW